MSVTKVLCSKDAVQESCDSRNASPVCHRALQQAHDRSLGLVFWRSGHLEHVQVAAQHRFPEGLVDLGDRSRKL